MTPQQLAQDEIRINVDELLRLQAIRDAALVWADTPEMGYAADTKLHEAVYAYRKATKDE